MEYRTVSAKLPSNELTMFRAHCEKKGTTPANLIRDLILKEMEITVPHTLAGKNHISYQRNKDVFAWSILLDDGKEIQVLQNISPSFVEDISRRLGMALRERSSFINQKESDSVPIPSSILTKKNEAQNF